MAEANCSAADQRPCAATAATCFGPVSTVLNTLAILRPVMAATIVDAKKPMPDPMASSSHTRKVQPDSTRGAVLPGWRTASGAADDP